MINLSIVTYTIMTHSGERWTMILLLKYPGHPVAAIFLQAEWVPELNLYQSGLGHTREGT